MKQEIIPRARLAPGQEWWTSDSPHTLAARVRSDRTVRRASGITCLSAGRYGMLVCRVKPRPPAWRKPVLVALMAAVMASGIGVAVWLMHDRGWLLKLIVIAVSVPLIIRILSGHRVRCVGLHCPGCRR